MPKLETDDNFRSRIAAVAGGEASKGLDAMTGQALDTEGARFAMARLEIADTASVAGGVKSAADSDKGNGGTDKQPAPNVKPRRQVGTDRGAAAIDADALQARYADDADPILRPGETEEQRNARLRAFHGRQPETGGVTGELTALDASRAAEAQVEGLGRPGTPADRSAIEAITGEGKSLEQQRANITGARETDTAYRTRLMAVARAEDGADVDTLNDLSGADLDQAGRDLGVDRMNAGQEPPRDIAAVFSTDEADHEYRRRLLPAVRRELLAPFHDASGPDLDAIGAHHGIPRGVAGAPRSPLAAQQGQDPGTVRPRDEEDDPNHPMSVLHEIRDFMARVELRLKHIA